MSAVRNVIKKLITPLLSISLIIGVWVAWHLLGDAEGSKEQAFAEPIANVRTEIELSESKIKLAGVKIGQVERRMLQATATVPGRVSYDESKHVHLRVATAGTITRILVKTGDQIKKGDLLAIVSSPEIGQSRATEKQQAAELELLYRTLNFQRDRRKGVESLVAAIKRDEAPEKIRVAHGTEQIGASRETLLTAYSQMLLAKSQIQRISGATESGAIAGRTASERATQLETAEASLRGSIEQILFDTNQEVSKAATAVESAQRQLELTRQQTATLMGYHSALELPARQESPGDNLSIVEVRSPLDGSVEQKLLAETERVSAGDGLLILADTSKLWIKAQLRESQWRGLTLRTGDVLKVGSSTLGLERLDAFVDYVGREVDRDTNAIPVVATLVNDGRLRPGLFVTVELPIGEKNECLTIPESAVALHEAQSFVFIPITEHKFQRRDVQLGEQANGWIEVKSGLTEGESITVQGVFYLKSELLLEAEE